jgi:ribonuclease E
MTKRMLIDATHAEETRVVVLDGNRLEDFDVEVASKKQLKGNIYLAKVIRVEPSLQAAFVEYGGGRHGFLAFSEIHPDYYQIPVADRQRLIALQAEEARAAEADEADADEREALEPAAVPQSGAPQSGASQAEPAARPALAADPYEPAVPDGPGGEYDTAYRDAPDIAIEAAGDDYSEPDAASPVHPGSPAEPAPADAIASAPAPAPDGGDDSGADSSGGDDEPDRPSTRAQPAAMARDEMFGPDMGAEAHGYPEPPHSDPAPRAGGTAPEPDAPAPAEAEPVAQTVEDPPEPADEPIDAAPPPTEPSRQAAAEPDGSETTHGGDGEPARRAGLAVDEMAAGDAESDEQPATAFDIPDAEQPPPEVIGGGDGAGDEAGADEARVRRTSRLLRSYRIQEVIHRRQIMLVQVVKEERGTKGAALTTYISLAGRFSVLMPNSPRGGGISRKITSAADRKRLREVTAELNLPDGMGLIVRTAGANRPKPEIKRDCEYLMRLWDDIREHTFRSVAPTLIYEEANLIKRAIRDVYSRDIDDIIVDGEEGWRAAHDFMRMLMPSHARKVQLWRGGADGQLGQSLFAKYQVEAQLDAMMSPTVPLKSGGYLVINQTEALVAIDVNSGRSTRERNIEETALRTNLEAADEAARQLRLRDLAGLIVIDFIDMESRKHNAAVERRLKDALREDRARIQVGSISHFGLLEMSRQRLRPSLAETNFEPCPHCGGTGHVRNIDSSAIHVLRAVEEEGAKQRAAVVMVHASAPVVMYLLNHKRERLAEIERRFAMRVQFAVDDQLGYGECRIDKVRGREELPVRPASALPVVPAAPVDLVDDGGYDDDEPDEAEERDPPAAAPRNAANGAESAVSAAEEGERRRRRRRRRRGGRRDGLPGEGAEAGNGTELDAFEADAPGAEESGPEAFVADAAEYEPETDTVAPPDLGGAVVMQREAHPTWASPRPLAEFSDVGEPPEDGVDAVARQLSGEDQPSIDPSELDENGLPKAGRRRGRRGGRRRRREGEEEGTVEAAAGSPDGAAAMPAYAAPVDAVPVYTGPTPADPFGAGFDIFDVIDTTAAPVPPRRAEIPVAVARTAPEPLARHGTVPASAPPSDVPPSDLRPSDLPPPQPSLAEPPPAEPRESSDLIRTAEARPEAEGQTSAAEPAAAGPGEPYVAPPIQPVLIGSSDVPPTDRKRGWWRR